jgi:hypothetical protein
VEFSRVKNVVDHLNIVVCYMSHFRAVVLLEGCQFGALYQMNAFST